MASCGECDWGPSEWQSMFGNMEIGYCEYPMPSFVPRKPIARDVKSGVCTFGVTIDGYSTPCFVAPCPCFKPKTLIEGEENGQS